MKQKYRLSSDLYDHYFFSKAFLIKYIDEMVDLDDICHFRAEIDSYPNYNEDNFFFKIDLMFADVTSTTSESVSLNDPDKAGFKVVATFESLLHNSFCGIREYVPVYFNDIYYSQVNVTLHTALISNFKNQNDNILLQFILYIPLKITENDIKKKIQQAPKPENFEQFFGVITNQSYKPYLQQKHTVKPNLVDEIYNTYVCSLRFNHHKFLKDFKDEAKRMIKNELKLQEFLGKIQDPPIPDHLQSFFKSENYSINDSLDDKSEDSGSEKAASDITQSFDGSEEFKGDDETSSSLNDSDKTEQSTTTLQKSLSEQEEKKFGSNSYYDFRKVKISLYFDLSKDATRRVLVNEIQREINTLAGCQFLLWNQYVELLRLNTIQFTKFLLDKYQIKINDLWGQSIFRHQINVKELYNFHETRTGKAHVKIAKKHRKNVTFKNREPLNVEDLNLFPKAKIHPIIFHEIYTKQKDAKHDPLKYEPLNRDEVHVIVLVHGFQGSSYDLRLFSNNITIKHPDAVFLHSSCNEDNTDGDIDVMGMKLAGEVKKFISSQLYGRKLQRLSFVGHSLGGLIMRSAIHYLECFQEQFFTFLTFSSPHMGFCFSQSKMVDAGLWFMKAWNKTQSLKQMTLADSKNIKETYIYKLALQSILKAQYLTFLNQYKQNLSKFKHFVLCSSPQDQYVPYHSARMQQTYKQSTDTKLSAVYDEMLKQIFNNISLEIIHRVDVSFEVPGKQSFKNQNKVRVVDNLIGRAAHIQFLENEALMKMLLSCFDYIFV